MNWRPKGWDSFWDKWRFLPDNADRHEFNRVEFEAGADAMLEAIKEEIKKSLLTDEQLEQLLDIDFATAYSGHVAEYRLTAQAQLNNTLKVLGLSDDENLPDLELNHEIHDKHGW